MSTGAKSVEMKATRNRIVFRPENQSVDVDLTLVALGARAHEEIATASKIFDASSEDCVGKSSSLKATETAPLQNSGPPRKQRGGFNEPRPGKPFPRPPVRWLEEVSRCGPGFLILDPLHLVCESELSWMDPGGGGRPSCMNKTSAGKWNVHQPFSTPPIPEDAKIPGLRGIANDVEWSE